MGERGKGALRVVFDRSLKLEFHGSKVTSDAGLLAYRELDEALGLTTTARGFLKDCRIGSNTQHSMIGPAAAIGVQPPGRIRRHQRCPAAVGGPSNHLERRLRNDRHER